MNKIKLGHDSKGRISINEEALRSAGLESAKKPVMISLGNGAALITDEGSDHCPMALFSGGITLRK